MNLADKTDLALFRAHMIGVLENGASDDQLDRIDDWVHKCFAQGDVHRALECAKIAVELLQDQSRPHPTAYALNTLVSIYASLGDGIMVSDTMSRLINHSINYNTPQAGLSGVHNVLDKLAGLGPAERIINLMAAMVRFHLHFKFTREAISTILTVANLLADYGAFQPAYHALADAERLAREYCDQEQLAAVLAAEANVAFCEGDHAFGNKAAGLALAAYEQLKQEPPRQLILNQATSAMQSGEFQKALAVFQEYEQSRSCDTDTHRLTVRVNMSVCLRRLGDVTGANEQIQMAREIVAGSVGLDPELLIELELVAAANAIKSEKINELASSIRNAANLLDAVISKAIKLHYRRASRERYVDRMEALLCSLPAIGPATDVVEVVACTRGNQLRDWLCVLDWADQISTHVSDTERAKLDEKIHRLANFGAPFLQGYREKYDDPLAGDLTPDPWREFADFAIQLSDRCGVEPPLAAACLSNAANLIQQRMSEGYAILVNLSTAGGYALLLLKDRYYLFQQPREETMSFAKGILSRREKTMSQAEFIKILQAYEIALIDSFSSMLSLIAPTDCIGLLFFPDRLDILPINLLMIGSESIRRRLASGNFEVRTCLAIYPRRVESRSLTNMLAIVETPSDLKLAEAQAESFCAVLGLKSRVIMNATASDVATSIGGADVLIVAQHGVPIALFADPNFANIEGPNQAGGIYFDVLQQSAYNAGYRLVILGACHSGVLVSRNAQRNFRSHELAGYPSILLTNRKSVVVGASWAILDRFEYLLSTQFAVEMRRESCPVRAFGKALASVVDQPANEVINLFDYIPDSDLRNEMNPVAGTEMPRIEFIKRQSYCYGAYHIYALM
jgi:tetratricopeptide (TPR) repeat protein